MDGKKGDDDIPTGDSIFPNSTKIKKWQEEDVADVVVEGKHKMWRRQTTPPDWFPCTSSRVLETKFRMVANIFFFVSERAFTNPGETRLRLQIMSLVY